MDDNVFEPPRDREADPSVTPHGQPVRRRGGNLPVFALLAGLLLIMGGWPWWIQAPVMVLFFTGWFVWSRRRR